MNNSSTAILGHTMYGHGSENVLLLHHWMGDGFVSGSDPWPEWVEEKRIDQESGFNWDTLKERMRGAMR